MTGTYTTVDDVRLELRPHPTNARSRERWLVGTSDGGWATRVPLRMRTVEAALDWLRPADVPAGAARQGDLYFVAETPPCERDDGLYESGTYYDDDPSGTGTVHNLRVTAMSTHRLGRHQLGTTVITQRFGDVAFGVGRRGRVKTHPYQGRPVVYTCGTVTHPEHAPVTLDGWHRVVPSRASQRDGRFGGDGD